MFINPKKEKEYPYNPLSIFHQAPYLRWWHIRNNTEYFFRSLKWAWQRVTRGYADTDLWNLDMYLTYLLPAMFRSLADNGCGFPTDMDSYDEWKNYLYKMAQHFENANDEYYSGPPIDTNKENWKKQWEEHKDYIISEREKGIEMLKKRWDNLWD